MSDKTPPVDTGIRAATIKLNEEIYRVTGKIPPFARCEEIVLVATDYRIAALEAERDRLKAINAELVTAMQAEAAHRCQYCRDGRKPFQRDTDGWWHHVARGGDLGDTEPCAAHQIHGALARATEPTDAVRT